MMKQIRTITATITCFLLSISSVLAQPEVKTSEVEFQGKNWQLEQYGEASETEYLGRKSMFLERSQLTFIEEDFSQGVIEFDLASSHASGFVGVNFRGDSRGNSEQFYVRFHQSGNPDATQYLAQFNGLASWQLHAGPNDATTVELGTEQWIRIRIVVEGDTADIFVRDMTTPALHIAELRTDNSEGNVVFYAFDRPGMTTGAYFSNITIRSLADGEGVVGSSRDEPQVPESVLRSWQISTPIDETKLAGQFEIGRALIDGLEWKEAVVEQNGILNIARYALIAPESQTVLVRLVVEADAPTARQLNFGYSDRVRIYVNGKQQFYGNAQWRSRDYRFLGTVGLHDSVILHLNEGANEVIAAVSESFGGWGFVGQLENREGLEINP